MSFEREIRKRKALVISCNARLILIDAPSNEQKMTCNRQGSANVVSFACRPSARMYLYMLTALLVSAGLEVLLML